MYEDIINLARPVSKTHAPMSISDRAAQFGSFAALRGHSDTIAETGRLTEGFRELDEYEKEIINQKLMVICEGDSGQMEIRVTHFIKDTKKTGGKYITTSGFVKKIDSYKKYLIMCDDTHILIDNIIDIDII